MADHDIGDLVYLDVTFRDDAGALFDPPDLDLKIRKPDGAEVTYSFPEDVQIVHISLGVFRGEITPDQAGTWGYRWKVPPGTGQGAEPGQFYVRPEFYELWRPTVDDVALTLRARAHTQGGLRLTTFTDETEPTKAEVERYIDRAAADVFADLEADPVPTGRYLKARSLATIRAAMYVELPTAGEDNSIYDDLKALYDSDLTKLKDAIVDAAGTGVDGVSPDAPLPLGTFPGTDVEVERAGWATWW
jgi:hypothetical protein